MLLKPETGTAEPEGKLFSKKEIRRLLVPVIAETLLSYLIGMADSVMVASAGEAAVSAVSLVDSISVLFINVFQAFSAGGAAVCGQFLGACNREKSRDSAVQMTVLMLVLSVVSSALLLIFQNGVIGVLFGSADAAVVENCGVYYHIVMYSVPFIALFNAGSALFMAVGDSRTPLVVSLIMNGINIIGNAVLIYVFKMGVAGVAIPTLVSRGIAMVIILALAMRKSFTLNLRDIVRFRPDTGIMKNILNIGLPNGIENGMFQFGKLILMSLVSTLPTAAITANAIGNTIGSLHCSVGISANRALITVISRCAGARDYRQARWYMRYFLKITYIWQGIANILLTVAIPLILKIYNVSDETARIATVIMLIHGISSIFLWPAGFMLNTGMRAAGDSQFAMIISTISMWLCRVGGAYLLVNGFGIGVVGVWIAWIVDWVFRIAFFVPRYLGHKWETKAITGE